MHFEFMKIMFQRRPVELPKPLSKTPIIITCYWSCLVHEKIEREASAPKEIETNQKITRKGGRNKKKSENGKSKL